MGRLTASGTPEAEARARRDLACVADAVQGAFGDLLALAVIGAFGRGEGAILQTEDGPVPWNDYDLVLITSTRRDWDTIGPLCARLKDELRLPGLDIVPFTPADLHASADTMLVVDSREGHVLLRGTTDPLDAIPPAKVARREALILLLNRMVCLLECPPATLAEEPPDPLRFPSQVSKAVLAVVDATLVEAGSYVVPYREKVARFRALAPDDPLGDAADEALAFRLEPGPRGWDDKVWHGAAARLVAALAALLGDASASPDQVARLLWRGRFLPLRQTLRSLRQGHKPDVRRRAVECAEVLVLAASDPEGVDQTQCLQSAWRYLLKAGPAPGCTRWADAARIVVRRWFEVAYGGV